MGDGVCAHGEAGKLEDASRAVPDNRARGRNHILDGRDGLGANVQTLPVGGKIDRAIPRLGFGVSGELIGQNVIDGQQQPDALGLGLLDGGFGHVDLVFFHEALAGGHAQRALECIGHAADNHQRIDLVEQIVDHVNLAGDFRPADDGHEGFFRRFQGLAEVGNFLFHQQAGYSGLEEVGDALGGSVGAMSGAEGVVDVDIGQRSQRL